MTRFTVRMEAGARTFSETFYVYDTEHRARASVHASTRECAQAEADQFNIGDLVRSYADDPRPYRVRRAEAEASYRLAVSR